MLSAALCIINRNNNYDYYPISVKFGKWIDVYLEFNTPWWTYILFVLFYFAGCGVQSVELYDAAARGTRRHHCKRQRWQQLPALCRSGWISRCHGLSCESSTTRTASLHKQCESTAYFA